MKSKDLRTNQSVLPSLHECQIPRRSLKHNNFSNPHLQRRNPDHLQQPAFYRHNSASEDKHGDASQATNQQGKTGHLPDMAKTWRQAYSHTTQIIWVLYTSLLSISNMPFTTLLFLVKSALLCSDGGRCSPVLVLSVAPAVLHVYLQSHPRNEKSFAWGRNVLPPIGEYHADQSCAIPVNLIPSVASSL